MVECPPEAFGLLIEHVERRSAQAIIRGCAVSDFEFEFQLALMNRVE
jgi:phosphopantetheine adenylyltransferase